ncbi:MAG: hypothetical protein H7Z21_05640 [Hymenobacter sp.]|nr:hypothetical protein [Hymenobacter sp.]
MTTVLLVKRLAFLTLLTLLAGCGCNNVDCVSCNLEEYRVLLRFSPDSLQGSGFRRSEANSAYVVRYANQDFSGARDTIRQELRRESYLNFYANGLDLSTLPAPAGATGSITGPFPQGSYRIVVPALSRQYDISGFDVAGETGDGCCACYRNTRRRFTLNGQYVTADGAPGITALTR